MSTEAESATLTPVAARGIVPGMTALTDLTPEQIAEREAKLDRLTEISAVLSKVDDLHLERGALYQDLKKLGMTRRELAAIAGVSAVTVDWATKRVADRANGAKTTSARRTRRQRPATTP